MRHPMSHLAVLGVSLSLAACGQDAPDPTGTPLDSGFLALAGGPVERPFNGSCNTSYEFVEFVYLPPPNDQVPVSGTAHHHGTCQFTHMGRTTLFLEQHYDFTRNPIPVTAALVLTAANGDQLFGSEVAELSLPDGDILEGSGAWTWNGGTGRFVGATGLTPHHDIVSLESRTVKTEVNGQITY